MLCCKDFQFDFHNLSFVLSNICSLFDLNIFELIKYVSSETATAFTIVLKVVSLKL